MEKFDTISGYILVNDDVPSSIELLISNQPGFPDLILNWLCEWNTKSQCQLKISEKNWLLLIQSFNDFVHFLAQKSQENNLWGKELADSANIFTPYAADISGNQKNGHAFVPQCKESTILQRLFLLNNEGNSERLTVYENATAQYSRAYPQSNWAMLDDMLTQALCLLTQLKLSLKEPADLDHKLTAEAIIPYLNTFNTCWIEIRPGVLAAQDTMPEAVLSSFYEISETELNQLSGHQLTCIVLEESNHESLSPLLLRIMTQQALWEKVQQAFQEGTYIHRTDQVSEKMRRLQWLQQIHGDTFLGQALKQQVALNKQLIQENVFIAELNKQQDEEIQRLKKAKSEADQLLEQEKMNTEKTIEELDSIKERFGRLKQRNQIAKSRLGMLVEKCNTVEEALEQYKATEQPKQYASIETQTSQEFDVSPVARPQSASRSIQTAELESNDLAAARKEQRLKELASVFHYIKLVKTKADNLKERHHQAAYDSANQLLADLDKEIEDYLVENNSLPEFKEKCQIHIQEAGKELKQWRGWERLLWNTLSCILNLGYMVTNGIAYTKNKEVTLFKTTKSAELLAALNNEISKLP